MAVDDEEKEKQEKQEEEGDEGIRTEDEEEGTKDKEVKKKRSNFRDGLFVATWHARP